MSRFRIAAFTLIEVLAAVFLTALVMSVAISFFVNLSDSTDAAGFDLLRSVSPGLPGSSQGQPNLPEDLDDLDLLEDIKRLGLPDDFDPSLLEQLSL